MSRLRNCLLVSISLLLFCACSKSPFSNGELKTETRLVSRNFRVVEMNDNVDVNLLRNMVSTSDRTTKIQIEANENLMDNIITEIHGDTLTIGNNSILNWTRPYDCTLKANVYYDSLLTIIYNSNGQLKSDVLYGCHIYDEENEGDSTILNIRSHVNLFVEGGSGDIDIMVNCDRMHTSYDFGTSKVTLRGNAGITYTSTSYNCHGPIDAKELETNYHYIYSYGTNKVIAKAFTEINGNNYNNGVICYVRYHTIRDEIIWGHYDENHVWIPQHVVPIEHSCPKRIIYHGPGPSEYSGLDSIVMQ